MYYRKNHSDFFEEIMTYILVMSIGTIGSLLIARINGISNPIELLLPMMGGLVVSFLLCAKLYFGNRKAEAEAIAKEREHRKKNIRSWCQAIHKKEVLWIAHFQIEGARNREWDEELQEYYY